MNLRLIQRITLFLIFLTIFFIPQQSFSQKDTIYTDVKSKKTVENVRGLIEKEDWNWIKRIGQEDKEAYFQIAAEDRKTPKGKFKKSP